VKNKIKAPLNKTTLIVQSAGTIWYPGRITEVRKNIQQ
jgi:hypothetical protein